MKNLLIELAGEDRRSIGKANEIVLLVENNSDLLRTLFQGLLIDDPVLKMRCADVIEKVSANHPDWIVTYKSLIINKLMHIQQSSIVWHIVAIVARLPLSPNEVEPILNRLLTLTNHKSSIVKSMTMQALVDITKKHTQYKNTIELHIKELNVIGTPAMKARAKKLLKELADTI